MLNLPHPWYAWPTEESILAAHWQSIRCVEAAEIKKTHNNKTIDVITENKREDFWQFKRKIAKRATKKGNSRVRYR